MQSSSDEYNSAEDDGFFENQKHQSKEERIYGIWSRSNRGIPGIQFSKGGRLDITEEDQIDVKPRKGERPHSPLPKSFNLSSDDEGADGDDEIMDLDDIEAEARGEKKTSEEDDEKMEDIYAPPGFSSSSSSSSGRFSGLGFGGLPTSFSSSKDKLHTVSAEDGIPQRSKFADHIERRQNAAKKKTHEKMGKGYAQFESNTKGFASKMMAKMGWKPGEGLGKTGEGRVNPVTAKKLGRNQGVGFGGPQRDEDAASYHNQLLEEQDKDDKKEAAAARGRNVSWRKDVSRNRKQKVKSIEKFLDEKNSAPKKVESFRDFTRNADGENVQIGDFETSLPAETELNLSYELKHNLAVLVELTEGEILKLGTTLSKAELAFRKAERDRNEMQIRLKEQEDAEQRQKELLEKLEGLEKIVYPSKEPVAGNGTTQNNANKNEETHEELCATLAKYADFFEEIQQKYPREYLNLNLQGLIVTYVFPIFHSIITKWDPINDPNLIKSIILRWSKLLSGESSAPSSYPPPQNFGDDDNRKDIDVFTDLLDTAIIPKIRKILVNDWKVKDKSSCESCVNMLQELQLFLPNGIVYKLLTFSVVPSIHRTVNHWEPQREHINISDWVLPWVPLIRDELKPAYETIQKKLMTALLNWTGPMDRSAIMLLRDWNGVFPPALMKKILTLRINPKIHEYFSKFTISRNQKDQGKEIELVLLWEPLIGVMELLKFFESSFFPKMFRALHTWLSDPNFRNDPENFKHVAEWYRGWRKTFQKCPNVDSAQRFQAQLLIVLDMMNAICIGDRLPEISLIDERSKMAFAAAQSSSEKKKPPKKPKRDHPLFPTHTDTHQLTFRETVEKFAQANGVDFTPNLKIGHYHGHQVFKFGTKNIYMTGRAIFVRKQADEYESTTLNELLRMAKGDA